MMAAVITFILLGLSWRWAYAVGALPAVLVFWIRRSVKEPEKWKEAKERATFGKEMGAMSDLFTDRQLRRRTIAALSMAIAGQAALWGVAFWSVDLVLAVLQPYHLPQFNIDRAKSAVFFAQQVGAMIGIYLFAAFSERTTRRTAFYTWFTLAWISIPTFFWGVAKAGGASFGIFTPLLRAITFTSAFPAGAQSAVHL